MARSAISLLIGLAVIGAYVLAQVLNEDPLPVPTETFIYSINERDITSVEITHNGDTRRFEWDERSGEWVFDDVERSPVAQDRWGGIPLLLSGPRVQRVLSVDQADLWRYGLDEPLTSIRLGLSDGLRLTVHVGIPSPDGENDYVVREGSPQIVLVDRSWHEVLARLVTAPPFASRP
ncbi:MAG: DUF4340 domain-containing protein [Chloroflexi bacterium]|nr:DUF4340 domain-containing protein [Chloroflexota bacterium]